MTDTGDDNYPPNFQYFSSHDTKFPSDNSMSPLDSMSQMMPHTGSSTSRQPSFWRPPPTSAHRPPFASSSRFQPEVFPSIMRPGLPPGHRVSATAAAADVVETTAARPFSCRLCGATFHKKYCLLNHTVSIHQVPERTEILMLLLTF